MTITATTAPSSPLLTGPSPSENYEDLIQKVSRVFRENRRDPDFSSITAPQSTYNFYAFAMEKYSFNSLQNKACQAYLCALDPSSFIDFNNPDRECFEKVLSALKEKTLFYLLVKDTKSIDALFEYVQATYGTTSEEWNRCQHLLYEVILTNAKIIAPPQDGSFRPIYEMGKEIDLAKFVSFIQELEPPSEETTSFLEWFQTHFRYEQFLAMIQSILEAPSGAKKENIPRGFRAYLRNTYGVESEEYQALDHYKRYSENKKYEQAVKKTQEEIDDKAKQAWKEVREILLRSPRSIEIETLLIDEDIDCEKYTQYDSYQSFLSSFKVRSPRSIANFSSYLDIKIKAGKEVSKDLKSMVKENKEATPEEFTKKLSLSPESLLRWKEYGAICRKRVQRQRKRLQNIAAKRILLEHSLLSPFSTESPAPSIESSSPAKRRKLSPTQRLQKANKHLLFALSTLSSSPETFPVISSSSEEIEDLKKETTTLLEKLRKTADEFSGS